MVRISILSLLIFLTDSAFAKPNLPPQVDSAAKNLYGAAASYKYDCAGCHGASGTNLATGFGVDFFNNYSKLYPNVNVGALSNAQVQGIISSMSLLDSDKDGANNQIEFVAGTNPGDPGSKPVAAPVCMRANPLLSLNPSSQGGVAGSLLKYNISITNKDSAECAASTFNLSSMAATGLSINLGSVSSLLSPGQSAMIAISVTSAANLPVGNYNFSIGAVNAMDTNYKNSVSGIYAVMSAPAVADMQAPTAPTNVSYVVEKRKYIISWSASSDNVGVVGYRVYSDGVQVADVSTLSAAIRLRRGAHAITVKAYDAAGKLSLPSVPFNIVK